MQQKTTLTEKTRVSHQVLKNSDALAAFKTLYDLVSSAQGPCGNTKILQNLSGGHLTLTSSSKRLLNTLSITKPVIELLVSSAQGHLDAYKDGGLFLLSLTCSLIMASVESDLNRRILSEIYEKFLTLCVEYLNSDECACKINAVLADIGFVKSCVRTVVQAKPLCRLNDEKLDLISRLLIEAFLTTVSDTGSSTAVNESVHIISHEGRDVLEGKLVTGLMLQAPELSKFKVVKLDMKRHSGEGNRIKVAMVTVSMSGDLEEVPDVKLEVWNGVDLESALVEQEMKFCQQIVECGVGMLLCQKVVHPKLKLELKRSGVIVVDRLGLNIVGTICKLTGACPIRSLLTSVQESSFGWLDNIEHVLEYGKSYLLLRREATLVSTLVLCHQEEEMLEELKDVCTTALHSLQMLLYKPLVLFGGGCWQSILALHLKSKIANERDSLSHELECSQSILMKSCELFTHALQMASLASNHRNQYYVDEADGHMYWNETGINGDIYSCETDMCCCNYQVKKSDMTDVKNVCFDKVDGSSCNFRKPSTKDVIEACQSRFLVLDNFTVCINALKTAVLTASTVLKIGQVISNV